MTKKSLQRRLSRAKKLYAGHAPKKEPVSQKVTRLALGGFMTMAGVSHLAWNRKTFQDQVPSWAPFSEDSVVVGSGLAEIGLGLSLLALPKERRKVGVALAAFYIAIFPGNVGQYAEKNGGFNLDTDGKRLLRRFGQPGLIAAALWAGGLPEKD